MAQKFTIRKNWASSFELMIRKPIVILPFFIIAFLEGLALELIYFSNRWPLSLIAAPIIRKFSGEMPLHYPFNLVKLDRYFLYSQLVIYIFAGVFLAGISINIVKNIKEGLPLKTNALIKNAVKRYLAFVVFGIIMVGLIFLLSSANVAILPKLIGLISKDMSKIAPMLYSMGFALSYFITSLIVQTLFVLTLPIIVIRKNSLLKAIAGSIGLGLRNFFGIFTLIFLPYLIYFPVTLLKTYTSELGSKTFPEICLYILPAGIIIAAFIDCFVTVCAAQFLLEKEIASAASPPARNDG